MSTSDQTAVTGSPLAGIGGPRRGQVLGERYEIRGRLRDDPFSFGFLAFDQETEDNVFLRVVRPELLEHADRKQVVREVRKCVGVGGKYLPGLLDADRDGPFVYASEPVPEGVSVRSVLDRRMGDSRTIEPHELLPILAHLDAALAAIPPPLRHGDLRAAGVWVDPDRLQLTGPFLVAALPTGVVAAVLQRHGDLRRRYAPEVVQGSGSVASDRYGVAALAHEALTLLPPPDPGASVKAALGPLARPLQALLHPDPRKRAQSLDPLIEAVGKSAGLAVPELEPAPFRTARRFALRSSPPLVDAKTDVLDKSGAAALLDDKTTGVRDQADPPKKKSSALLEDSTTGVRDPAAPKKKSALLDDLTTDELPMVSPGTPGDTEKMPAMDSERAAEVLAAAKRAREASKRALDPDSETRLFPASEKERVEKRKRLSKAAGKPRRTDPPRPVRPSASTEASTEVVKDNSEERRLAKAKAAKAKAAEDAKGAPTEGEKHDLDGIDPRLLRAAAAKTPPPGQLLGGSVIETLDSADLDTADLDDDLVGASSGGEGGHHLPAPDSDSGDLDPRLVRAALGMTMEPSGAVPLDPSVPAKPAPDGTQELAFDELEAMSDDAVPMDPAVPAKAAAGGTQEIGLDELEAMADAADLHPPKPVDPAEQLSLEDLEEMERERRRAAVPEAIKGIPRPRRDSGLMAAASSLYDDSRHSSAPPPAVSAPEVHPPVDVDPDDVIATQQRAAVKAPILSPDSLPPPRPRAPRLTDDTPTRIARAGDEARKAAKPRPFGMTLVLVAFLLGVLILAGSFAYAAHRRHQADEEREQRLHDRFERLQRGEIPGARGD